jgi:protein arginine N-methyltransferase 1
VGRVSAGARVDPRARYAAEEVWFACSLHVESWQEDFHELLLGDRLRMDAYRRAIRSAVRPGMVVVDLGTGTGVLAAWALEAGARVVYGIEVNADILERACERMERAGFAERFRPVHALSTETALPEKADLIISEILGNLADNEGMTAILDDARARLLVPGGRVLPAQATTSLVPVSAVEAHRSVAARRCRGLSEAYELDALLARLRVTSPFHIYYDAIIPARAHLASPLVAAHFAFDGSAGDGEDYARVLEFTVATGGLFTGFKGSFAARLTEDVVLDISGDDIAAGQTSDSWKHCYLPVDHPTPVEPGDLVVLTYRRARPAPGDGLFLPRYGWNGCVRRGGRVLAEF